MAILFINRELTIVTRTKQIIRKLDKITSTRQLIIRGKTENVGKTTKRKGRIEAIVAFIVVEIVRLAKGEVGKRKVIRRK